jgi:selenoprotein W-related protein
LVSRRAAPAKRRRILTAGGKHQYSENPPTPDATPGGRIRDEGIVNHRIEIHYCTQCRWLLRAAWMAQELLTTFDQEIAELTLRPGTGGVFEVRADGELVWSRKEQGRFPEITELKQLVRDHIAPERDLGHSDRKAKDAG